MSIKWKECATYKPEEGKALLIKDSTGFIQAGYYNKSKKWVDPIDGDANPHFWCYQEEIE